MKSLLAALVILSAMSVRADLLEGTIAQVRTNGIHMLVVIRAAQISGGVGYGGAGQSAPRRIPDSTVRVFVEGYTNAAAIDGQVIKIQAEPDGRFQYVAKKTGIEHTIKKYRFLSE